MKTDDDYRLSRKQLRGEQFHPAHLLREMKIHSESRNLGERDDQDFRKKVDCNQELETIPETPGEARLPLLNQLRVDGK